MINLEKELLKNTSKRLAEEIDWGLLVDMFVKQGWTMIDLPPFKDRYEAIDIELWIDDNCTGKHSKRGKTFVFEKKEDAAWFSLRWI